MASPSACSPTPDLRDLAQTAGEVLEAVSPRFRADRGAAGVVGKGDRDFATQVDLDLERFICDELTTRTGLPCHGEEFGGPPVDEGLVWVVDPVDGSLIEITTTSYQPPARLRAHITARDQVGEGHAREPPERVAQEAATMEGA